MHEILRKDKIMRKGRRKTARIMLKRRTEKGKKGKKGGNVKGTVRPDWI